MSHHLGGSNTPSVPYYGDYISSASTSAAAAASSLAAQQTPTSSRVNGAASRRASVTSKNMRGKLESLVVKALLDAGPRGFVLADICRHIAANNAAYRSADPDNNNTGRQLTAPSGGGSYNGDDESDDDEQAAGRCEVGNWRNNVRQLLSTRGYIVRTREPNPIGRGYYWRLDEKAYDKYVLENPQKSLPRMRSTGPATGCARGSAAVHGSLSGNVENQQMMSSAVNVQSSADDFSSAAVRLSMLQDRQAVATSPVFNPNQFVDQAAMTSRLTSPGSSNPSVLQQHQVGYDIDYQRQLRQQFQQPAMQQRSSKLHQQQASAMPSQQNVYNPYSSFYGNGLQMMTSHVGLADQRPTSATVNATAVLGPSSAGHPTPGYQGQHQQVLSDTSLGVASQPAWWHDQQRQYHSTVTQQQANDQSSVTAQTALKQMEQPRQSGMTMPPAVPCNQQQQQQWSSSGYGFNGGLQNGITGQSGFFQTQQQQQCVNSSVTQLYQPRSANGVGMNDGCFDSMMRGGFGGQSGISQQQGRARTQSNIPMTNWWDKQQQQLQPQCSSAGLAGLNDGCAGSSQGVGLRFDQSGTSHNRQQMLQQYPRGAQLQQLSPISPGYSDYTGGQLGLNRDHHQQQPVVPQQWSTNGPGFNRQYSGLRTGHGQDQHQQHNQSSVTTSPAYHHYYQQQQQQHDHHQGTPDQNGSNIP